MRADELDIRFTGAVASQLLATADHDRVREGCRLLAHGLNDVLPDGGEKALALTHLEQVMFWAHAAIARPVEADA